MQEFLILDIDLEQTCIVSQIKGYIVTCLDTHISLRCNFQCHLLNHLKVLEEIFAC